MKHFKLFLALGIFLILCSTSWADIPNLINFQGILDSAGNPMANKTVSVEFKIYDTPAGGALFWSETQSVTTNAGGVFNVILGTSNPVPDSAFDDTLRYLGIKVGTDAEMTPRQQIVSNAYGYRVSTVDGARGGVISGDVEIQSKLIADTVGIGTSGPIYKLHIVESNSLGDDAIRVNQQGVGDGIEVIHEGAAGSGAKFQTTNPSNATVALFVHSDGSGPLMALEKGAENKFFVDNSGNVGIGTASPLSQLHLESSNPISEGIRIYNTSATGDPNIHFLTDGVFQYTLGVDNDDGDKLQISGGSTLNSSELLTLTTTGNVGIGTTSPTEKLHVASAGNVNALVENTAGVGYAQISTEAGAVSMGLFAEAVGGTGGLGTNTNHPFYFRTNLVERMRITEAGNVGIGTTSPSSKLDVNLGTTDAKFTGFGTNNTGLNLINTDVTSRTWALWALGNSGLGGPAKGFAIADVTIPATRLVIDVAGNVGIGTANPTQKLDVSGIGAIHMLAQTTSSGNVAGVGVANPERQWFLQVRGELGGAPFVIRDGTAGEYRLAINSTGNVGIGTTSPGNILTVVQNSSTDPIADAWTTYSSAEYKQGIHELTDQEYTEALQKLLATPVVKYRYKGQSFMDKEKIGIVIEEAPEEIISEGNQKAASLNEYISLLHAGLKAQQNQIESQQTQIKKLVETINQLTKEE